MWISDYSWPFEFVKEFCGIASLITTKCYNIPQNYKVPPYNITLLQNTTK
jgi:hypothetical protein